MQGSRLGLPTRGARRGRRRIWSSLDAPALTEPLANASAQPAMAAAPSPVPATGNAHPATDTGRNERLFTYETRVKDAFERIVPVLKSISALQHEADFEPRAQAIAGRELGFELPQRVLDRSWVTGLDLRALYAHAVFETFRVLGEELFRNDPLEGSRIEQMQRFFRECGFHRVGIAPCSDGRLAHVVSYVLRLPYAAVRRKSSAGALFDVEESVQRWVETELARFREARPNPADEPTRYLKIGVYHYSGSDPEHEGCAAHGYDESRAARAALDRLEAFRAAIENSFCCGASIDLLLLGVDTDTDVLRVHIPDEKGRIDLACRIEADAAYAATQDLRAEEVEPTLVSMIASEAQARGASAPQPGMARLIARLLMNNFAQLDYVRAYHGGAYSDIGHQERLIGVGVGFEEVQLRNLTFFAHMETVEEGADDLDVGVRIFEGLNVSRGLPIPVVIRLNYDGNVPGSKERSIARCRRMQRAIHERYHRLFKRGLLQTCLSVRDCNGQRPAEYFGAALGSEIGA